MRTIAIMNNKGGVGKTVTAVNLADILVRQHKKRVLLIDCDGQCNSTRFFWAGIPEDAMTLAEVLIGQAEPVWSDNTHEVMPGLHLLPSTDALDDLDINTVMGTADSSPSAPHVRALRDFVRAAEEDGEIDVVLMDCPTGFTASSCAALLAADEVIVPAVLDGFSFDGIDRLQRQLRRIRRVNRAVRIGGILITQWHRCDHVVQAEALMRRRKLPVYHTVIRRTDKVPESTFARAPLPVYSPHSAAGRDYALWVEELLGEEVAADEI